MKILYTSGNRIGGDVQLHRFLQDCPEYEVKIAAYSRSSQSLQNIDWTLDALNHKYSNYSTKLNNIFGFGNVPQAGTKEIETLISGIEEFAPDLMINNHEPITANIAKAFGLEIWYCSPLFLVHAVDIPLGMRRYVNQLRPYSIHNLPEGRKLVYSPFGEIKDAPKLKPGYEWVRPYYIKANKQDGDEKIAVVKDDKRISDLTKIFNCIFPFDLKLFSPFSYGLSHTESGNIYDEDIYSEYLSACSWFFTTGESSYLADIIYNNVGSFCISPAVNDPEALINALILEKLGFGDHIGQVERMGRYAVEIIENSVRNRRRIEYFEDKNIKTLGELL